MYYTAFFKRSIHGCNGPNGSCSGELTTTLLIIVVTNDVVMRLPSWLPFFFDSSTRAIFSCLSPKNGDSRRRTHKKGQRKTTKATKSNGLLEKEVEVEAVVEVVEEEGGEAEGKESLPEDDEIFAQFLELEEYNLVIEKPEEYLQLIMQFGYLSMFGAAFPLGAAIAVLVNFVEIQFDCHKLLNDYQRIAPLQVNEIGEDSQFVLILYFSIPVNLALVVYTFDMLGDDRDLPAGKVWLFVLATLVLVVVEVAFEQRCERVFLAAGGPRQRLELAADEGEAPILHERMQQNDRINTARALRNHRRQSRRCAPTFAEECDALHAVVSLAQHGECIQYRSCGAAGHHVVVRSFRKPSAAALEGSVARAGHL